MTIQLTPELEAFVVAEVSSGRYSSTSEVIEAGIRLLHEKDEADALRLQEQRRELDGGIEQADRGELIAAGEALLHKIGERYKQDRLANTDHPKRAEWPPHFFEETYGCLADDPIERLPQGNYPDWDKVL